EFLEGDPDRPLVTGSVYNDDNKYPFDLPKMKNISGVVSDSTKGHHGRNFFTFDDTKGKEVVSLQAEKDYSVEVKDSERRHITKSRDTVLEQGNDSLNIKKGDYNAEVSGTHFTHAKGDFTATANKEMHLSINFAAGSFISMTTTNMVLHTQELQIFAPLITI